MKSSDKKTIALSIFMILLLGALSLLRTSSFDDSPPVIERERTPHQEEVSEEKQTDDPIEEFKYPFSNNYEEAVPEEYRHLIPEEYKRFLPENGQEMSPEEIREMIPEEYRHLIPEEHLEVMEENKEDSPDKHSFTSHEIDEKIKLSIPISWVAENAERSGPLQIVAFFSSPEPSPSPVLSVFKSPFSDIGDIIKAIEEDIKKENMQLDVVKKENVGNNTYYLESEITEDFLLSLSRKKILIFDEESFIISFVFPEKEKERHSSLGEEILSSVEIIE